ncbi:MAG: hypothetical protein QOI20_2193 [Acidimicrobiaceae bacterium]|nr:hypothetical protein [Acidimicrobiaceae bacterium]
MAYAFVAIVFGGLVGLALGGRLRNLGEHRLAAWPLLPAGVVLQLLSGAARNHADVALALLLASYVALGAFAAANARVLGMALVGAGLAANLLVIAVNQGMPVRRQAAIDAGIARSSAELDAINLKTKHHYERPSDDLMFLADVIPVRPLREVLSLGDAVMSVGIAAVVAALLRREPAHPQPEPTGSLPSEG